MKKRALAARGRSRGERPVREPSADRPSLFKGGFDLSEAQFERFTLGSTGTGPLLRPAFGVLTDRVLNYWLASAILLWSTVFISIYGF